jgi:hypothetical protein
MGQYLALRQPNSDPDLVGLISKKSSPHDIALQVIADAAYVCRRTHGDAPEVWECTIIFVTTPYLLTRFDDYI